MAKPTMPRILFELVGNWAWRFWALQHGQLLHLRDRPFE